MLLRISGSILPVALAVSWWLSPVDFHAICASRSARSAISSCVPIELDPGLPLLKWLLLRTVVAS